MMMPIPNQASSIGGFEVDGPLVEAAGQVPLGQLFVALADVAQRLGGGHAFRVAQLKLGNGGAVALQAHVAAGQVAVGVVELGVNQNGVLEGADGLVELCRPGNTPAPGCTRPWPSTGRRR